MDVVDIEFNSGSTNFHTVNDWLEKDSLGINLTIIHVNIRSIERKWDELNIILQNVIKTIDVLILTEINIKEEGAFMYNIPGFQRLTKCRKVKKGGGIAVFVREKYSVKIIGTDQTSFESMHLLLNLNEAFEFTVLAIYRPPDLNKVIFLEELENEFKICNVNQAIIIGDINVDIMKDTEATVQKYETLMATNGFMKCISDYTRVEIRLESIVKSCVDHAYVRSKQETSGAIIQNKISDHYMIGICMRKTTSIEKETKLKTNKRIDEHVVAREIGGLDINHLNCTNASALHDQLKSYISEVHKSGQRLTYAGYRVNKGWMGKDLSEAIKHRDDLFKIAKNNPSNKLHRESYKKERNKVNKLIEKAKKQYVKQQLDTHKLDTKKTWEILNNMMGKEKKSVDDVINRHFGKNYSNKQVANMFAITFKEQVETLKHTCNFKLYTEKHTNISHSRCFYLPDATDEDILLIINKIKTNMSAGYDGIRPKDIKYMVDNVSIIVKFVNLSLKAGHIPEDLKIAIVRPIYKNGSHLNPSNYRPVSILAILDKIIENYVAKYLSAYLEKYGLIDTQQYAFQAGKSCNDLLEDFANQINSNLGKNNFAVCMFIDLSKAFDTLEHSKILESLQQIGIRGHVLTWFENYLTNRKYVVKVNDTLSDETDIECGVPQGSILGPLLYIIYANGLFQVPKRTKMYMFADDTALVATHKDLSKAVENLQEDFTKFLQWAHDMSIIPNKDKTKVVPIHVPKMNVRYNQIKIVAHCQNCLHNGSVEPCQNCKIIEVVENHTYLGVVVDDTFSWSAHIQKLCKQLRHISYKLYYVTKILPSGISLMLYKALAESVLRHGIGAWGNASNCYLLKITDIQKRILKIIKTPDHHQNVFQAHQVLEVTKLYKLNLILKYYFSNKYKNRVEFKYQSRNSIKTKYKVNIPFNKYDNRTLQIAVPNAFNLMPQRLLHFDSKSKAKKEVKNWLVTANGK